jgi:hypothetical protein
MAQENLDFNINVKTQGAEGSIGSLKKQLREAQNEVVSLSDKFGATSQQAVLAAKKAAELRDRIGDAKALTDAFNPDQKFRALTASLSGVAGGFGAVQGAMALFGNESENVQKTLLKVQSAMALSQGLEAVGNSVDAFKNLGTVIRTQVVSAFGTLRGAIIATGVGALAVGLGLLIANFDKIKETLLNLFPSLGEFGNKIKGIIQGITDFAGITSKAARAQDDLKKSVEASIFSLDQSIKILQSQDGKEDEIYKLKKQRIKEQIKLLGDVKDEEIRKKIELNTELQVLDNQEAARKKKKEEDDKLEAQKKAKEKADYDKAVALFNKNAAQEVIDEDERLRLDGIKLQEEADASDAKIEAASTQAKIDAVQYKTKLTIDSNNAVAKNKKDKTDEEKAEDERLALHKKKQVDESMQLMSQLSDFVGKDTVAGKALGIATATINTYQGASEALKQKSTLPSPFDVIAKVANVASIIAVGIKTVKSIASVQVPNGGGGGGMPSLSNIAPIAPQLPSAGTTNISQQSINDIGNQAVRAYVIESDVTSNQQRIAAIRQRARFS